MPEIDLSALISTAMGGASVWALIRLDIKYLWRDVGRLEKRVERLEQEKAAV